jgi:hypothetical protein
LRDAQRATGVKQGDQVPTITGLPLIESNDQPDYYYRASARREPRARVPARLDGASNDDIVGPHNH